MLGAGRGECNSGNVSNEANQLPRTLSVEEKRSIYKLVERGGLFFQASDDELTEVDHILAEPVIEKDFVDGLLNFESENKGKYLLDEGSLCHSNYHQLCTEVQDAGNLIGVGREDPEADSLDGMLQGVLDLHHQSAVEDYLLDPEFSDNVLDYVPCEEHHIGNSISDNPSESLNMRGRVAVEKPTLMSCTTSIHESSSYSNALDRMNICELQERFRSTFGRETSVMDKEWLKRRILFGLQNNTEWDSVSCFLRSDISSSENEGNLIPTCSEDSSGRGHRSSTDELVIKTEQACQVEEKGRSSGSCVPTANSFRSQSGGHGLMRLGDREGISLTQKRSWKPTQRYVEESVDLNAKPYSGKLEISDMVSRGSFRRPRSHNRKRRKGLGATPLVFGWDESSGCSIQVPFAPQVRNSPSRKDLPVSTVEHDSKDTGNDLAPSLQESKNDLSDDVTISGSKSCVSGRKFHKVWSLSEVHKLVEGVSQYGVGRWSQIKNDLFKVSAHRTSVDLKDKWRNLLRASDVQLRSKRKVDRKNPKCIVPTSLLRRVKELAAIHPYPRNDRKPKVAHHEPVSSP